MKISEMNNEQAAKALIRIAKPVSNICDDADAVKMFDELKGLDKMPVLRAVGKMLPQFVQYALVKHKDDLFEIIGALTEKSMKEVQEMRFFDTLKVVRDSYDEVLAGFFTSSGKQTNGQEGK